MKKICNQCQTEMIEDFKVESYGGITISKKGKFFLNTTYGKPKAAVVGCVISQSTIEYTHKGEFV